MSLRRVKKPKDFKEPLRRCNKNGGGTIAILAKPNTTRTMWLTRCFEVAPNKTKAGKGRHPSTKMMRPPQNPLTWNILKHY